MASILDLLQSDLGQTLIQGASQKTGQPADKTANVLSQAMPLILGAMQRNASTPEGAAALNNALENPKHSSGSVLDMLGGIFGDGPGSPEELENDGAGILGHVLGAKQPRIETALSQSSGMDMQSVSKIIKIAAPILMGMLGKQKQTSQTQSNGIGDLLGSVLGQSGSHDQSFIETLLDSDGDGSIVDDVAGMVLGGNKKKGGLGGLLGGLFGK
ncbi:hypothetical protein AAT17_12920 [Nonlabens sp. MIC269]|uniref:DUF937 domain-containing protein n=1 Tax=Nonlabens TaxID=363408 RepID=UPI000721AC9F|nr:MULTISPECIES: DUF937 domain-containing protein [Nonlabens]ALM19758.1 hypothetical protein AAT17_00030 [Nonlabens sp. MIC269]ALM22065.1 hypothetical protein AAT17_12920 [Nonlabens sp. MIC269]ARN71238.1 hypothetical protein BST91_06035 [Nonlabens tegetincola]MEE2802809.1 DUF937 domain-containing protein [Bacteroidota bacterium]